MNKLKLGSKWTASNGKKFRVLNLVEIDGNQWIHYIEDGKEDPREFSCFLESFLSRFTEGPENDATPRIN
jgi:hypothetical protein